VIQYRSSFAQAGAATERVTLMRTDDGYRVAGYYVVPR